MASKKLNEKEIQDTFKKLGLDPNTPYPGVKHLANNFERCTIYREVAIQYSSGACTRH